MRDAGLRGELAIIKRGTFPTGWHVDLEQLIAHFERQRRNYLDREHRPRGRDKTKRKARRT
jgi:hypothetical protein